MRRVQQQPPIPGLPKNSQRDAVEKYEKSGTLCEHAEPEKSRGRNPNQPRGFLLSPKTQPKMMARPESETYSASISINRPFSIIPIFVSQMSEATVDPRGPRLARATVTNAIATASTARAEGRRAVHSFRTPKILNDTATSQFTNGGFRKYGLVPTCGTT